MNFDMQTPAIEQEETTPDTQLWPVRVLMVGMLAIAKGIDILATIVGLELGHYEANPLLAIGFESIGIIPTSLIVGLVVVTFVVVLVELSGKWLRRHNLSRFTVEGVRFGLYMIPTLVWLGVGLRNLRIVSQSAEPVF